MQTVFHSYSDPGHGWAKVPLAMLRELGIASEITPYSYMKGDYAYLEEDCDLSTFMRAMDKRGVAVKFRHHTADKRSRIRNFNSYSNA